MSRNPAEALGIKNFLIGANLSCQHAVEFLQEMLDWTFRHTFIKVFINYNGSSRFLELKFVWGISNNS